MSGPNTSAFLRPRIIPSLFHEVLGERQTLASLAVILAAPVLLWALTGAEIFKPGAARPLWQTALAALLITDIFAGVVANFTHGTGAFYAARPVHRWGFIAIHFHLPIVALALGWEMGPIWAVWAMTILAASALNLLGGARLLGGTLLVFGLIALTRFDLAAGPHLLASLFFIKVAYAFAVDHYGDRG